MRVTSIVPGQNRKVSRGARMNSLRLLGFALLALASVLIPGQGAATEPPAAAQEAEIHEWRMIRGNPSRSAFATGNSPVVEAAWRNALLSDASVKEWIGEVSKKC